ncbi:MAG: hypothetical protein OEV99_13800 [Nitrospira sp.]|nr:hypothetical protein [Nitrospira sp.]MDH4370898.1 hypothetical protein [Nitrospira sp.]
MRNSMCPRNGSLVPLAMGAIVLAVMGFDGRSLVQATDQGQMHVDITITDLGYSVKGHTMPDSLTSITVRNNGTIPHGIASPAFTTGVIKKEGEGVEMRDSKGKGFKAYHLEPGKIMTLHFSKASTPERETTQVPFWCDLHTHMKGEFLVVETRGETGGG